MLTLTGWPLRFAINAPPGCLAMKLAMFFGGPEACRVSRHLATIGRRSSAAFRFFAGVIIASNRRMCLMRHLLRRGSTVFNSSFALSISIEILNIRGWVSLTDLALRLDGITDLRAP